MNTQSLFVGSVALVLGLLAVVAAIHNHDWYFQIPKARWIETRWGRGTARVVYAVLGLVLIIAGILIAWEVGRHPSPNSVLSLY
jgi:hypothetical protein